MQRVQDTFLEWAESLPEDQEAIISRFLHSLSHATSVLEINIAAGIAYQALTGVDG